MRAIYQKQKPQLSYDKYTPGVNPISIGSNSRALLHTVRPPSHSALDNNTSTSQPNSGPGSTTSRLSPIISSISPPVLTPGQGHSMVRRLSSSSAYRLADIISTTSAPSVASVALEHDVDAVIENGLRHADVKLEARNSGLRQLQAWSDSVIKLHNDPDIPLLYRQYKSPSFAILLLNVLQTLRVPSWSSTEITPQRLQVHKVSGSLTNAVFFISCPSVRGTSVVLLRIYGPSSGSLISRPRELHSLHILSSQYHIGPRVYGTFENGRVEEYFESTTLTASDLRDPKISRWIGARMAELHSVDIEVMEGTTLGNRGEGKGWEIGAKKNVESWLGPAQDVLNLPSVSEAIRKQFDLNRFKKEWHRYMRWLSKVEDVNNGSRRVFAHNDAQYGNLLRLTKDGIADHRQIIVVDFEYASPNPAAFDIANHFHEWTADYHSSTPHILDPTRYPTFKERRNFYAAYLAHSALFAESPMYHKTDCEAEIEQLDKQVRLWSPATQAMWSIWGIVQAREDLENDLGKPEFDYLSYARCRMEGFRRELKALGL